MMTIVTIIVKLKIGNQLNLVESLQKANVNVKDKKINKSSDRKGGRSSKNYHFCRKHNFIICKLNKRKKQILLEVNY